QRALGLLRRVHGREELHAVAHRDHLGRPREPLGLVLQVLRRDDLCRDRGGEDHAGEQRADPEGQRRERTAASHWLTSLNNGEGSVETVSSLSTSSASVKRADSTIRGCDHWL